MSYGGASNDDSALRPTHGGRVLLELESVDSAHAHYVIALAEPQGVMRGRASVALSPAIGPEQAVLLEVSAQSSDWLRAQCRRFLVTLAKDCRGAHAEPWPARVLRWRTAG